MLKKKTPAPTFEERLNSAHAGAAAAVSTFELVAQDLESSAADKRQVAGEILDEIVKLEDLINRYDKLRDEAIIDSEADLAKAEKIRALVSA